MRKTLIIALGLVSFGALAGVQPAVAELQTICRDHFVITSPGLSSNCNTSARWKQNNCTLTPHAGGFKSRECYTANVPPAPTAPWNGTAGYNNSINQLNSQKKN